MTAMPERAVPTAWSLCAVVVALILTITLASCSSSDEDRAAVAAAKCSVPVSEKAGFPEDSLPQYEVERVKDLGEGRYRVTGWSTIVGPATKAVEFICELAPDDGDKLRGFKVTHLEVTPMN